MRSRARRIAREHGGIGLIMIDYLQLMRVTGQLDDEDWARISGTMGILLEKRNIYIDDSSGLTPTEVRSRARRIAREHGGIGLIMIDYLQLMRV
ncbi:hypothetical protein CP990_28460, partial [Escherichia coli]